MPARILHVGVDACNRMIVLQNAGYLVEECSTLAGVRLALETDPKPDALVFTEDQRPFFQQAVRLVEPHFELPIILFGEPQRNLSESQFDLVIPFLAPPEAWLAQLAALVAHSQAVRIRSTMKLGESYPHEQKGQSAIPRSDGPEEISNPKTRNQ